MTLQKNLSSIAEFYKTDKKEHGYTTVYEEYFESLRNQKLKILEIGIADGKSLLTWSDYFNNSTIIGIDIHKINIIEKKLDRDNIKVHQGSQSDESFINEIISKYGNFDIISIVSVTTRVPDIELLKICSNNTISVKSISSLKSAIVDPSGEVMIPSIHCISPEIWTPSIPLFIVPPKSIR